MQYLLCGCFLEKFSYNALEGNKEEMLEMRKHYEKMIQDTEKRVRHGLRVQVKDGGENHGGFQDAKGIVQPKYAIYTVTSAISVYCNKDSCFYRDPVVYKMIREGLEYVIGSQHDNGLFDFIVCNFLSTPDTAFCIKRILPTLSYLEQNRATSEEDQIYKALLEIVKKGAKGLAEGGFHTPNHRWAIASMLMECGRRFEEESLVKRAKEYLLEGIDCNDDGEFAEKSAGNYNRVNNDAMISLGHTTGDETYFGYAARNLKMMLTYIEPDGSVFTGNSTRWDNGLKIYPKDYYFEYLEMGILLDIPEFLDMANYIFQLVDEKGIKSPDQLIHYMNHPQWIDLEHEGVWHVPSFCRFYKESGIARIGKPDYIYTIMKEKTSFFHLSTKSMQLQLKLGGAYFERRAFEAKSMEQETDGVFHLEETMNGWYYLPFKEKQPTSDWWKMENHKRDKVLGPDLNLQADIKEIEDGVEVHIKVSGVKNAPFRVEVAVNGAQLIRGQQFELNAEPGRSMILKEGYAVFSNSEESLSIGPGFGTHSYTAGNFGSEGASAFAFTLYFTDYTEFEHTFQIHVGSESV